MQVSPGLFDLDELCQANLNDLSNEASYPTVRPGSVKGNKSQILSVFLDTLLRQSAQECKRSLKMQAKL